LTPENAHVLSFPQGPATNLVPDLTQGPADAAAAEPARASGPQEPSTGNDDCASLSPYKNDDDDGHVPTNGRTELSVFERAYDEGFLPAFIELAGARNGDRVDPPQRKPTRAERFELMRLAVVALQESCLPMLFRACAVTRDTKKIDISRLNHVKGTFANLAGFYRDDLFKRIDGIKPPEQFLRSPDTASDGAKPEAGQTARAAATRRAPPPLGPPPDGCKDWADYGRKLKGPPGLEK
jgi:hypothetical protein